MSDLILELETPSPFVVMEHAQYLKDGLGHSDMVRILRSPLHYKWTHDNPPEPTPAMALGTATHTAVLEPKKFDLAYTVKPNFDRRTKAGKEDSAAWDAAHAGQASITQDEMDALRGMQSAVQSHATARSLLQRALRERSYFWNDQETGVRCRMRPDAMVIDAQGGLEVIIDLKTTRNAAREAFARDIYNMGYDLQAALYTEGVRRATGKVVPFLLLAVENTAPYGVALYQVGERTLEVGCSKYRAALELYAWCDKEQRWPSYQLDGVEPIDVPGWARGIDE